jgi:D-3-phosphoglycerate dehydrogenase
MAGKNISVAVTSRSFSKNKILREELLSKFKSVTFNDLDHKLEGDTLVKFLSGHDRVITALEKIDYKLLEQLPNLRVISKYGVGVDMIDMDAMEKHGVRLGWTGGVNKRSVSELVISFAIALLRHVPDAHREVLSGTCRSSAIANEITNSDTDLLFTPPVQPSLTPCFSIASISIISTPTPYLLMTLRLGSCSSSL